MAFNGSGTFNRNTGVYTGSTAWTQTRDAGRKVRADDHDTHDQDIATGLSNCITKDGQTTVTANLPMAGFKHTGCADGSASTDYATLGQVQAGVSTQKASLSVANTTYSADATGVNVRYRKSRGAAPTTNTIVQNGDEIAYIAFAGADGSTFQDAAAIQVAVDGVPGATNDMPGRISFLTKADNSASMLERMRIDKDGWIGIGVAPGADLHLEKAGATNVIFRRNSADGNSCTIFMQKSRGTTVGSVNAVQNGDCVGAIIFDGADGTGYKNAASIEAWIDGTPGAGDLPGRLIFATTPDGSATRVERMRIANNGNVSIGTTTTNHALTVGNGVGTVESTVNGANSGTAGGAAVSTRVNGTAVIAIGNYSGIVGGAYAANPTIWGSGTVFRVVNLTAGAGTHAMRYNNTNGEWTYDTSSARFKENIRPIQYGLAAVNQLAPKQFAYKEGKREDVGFIAEETATVIPEVVALDKDGLPESVSYDRLTAVLCKAIQELSARVEALEAAG